MTIELHGLLPSRLPRSGAGVRRGFAFLVVAAAAAAWTGSAAAAWLGAPPSPDTPRGLYVPVETTVDQMPPEMGLAYIRGIQEELAAHGYKPGPVDGVVGGRTRGAIRAYQKDAGLPVTGAASRELLDHLKFAAPKVFARPAPAGPSRELVTEIQRGLYMRGYYQAAIDGLSGPATRDAVRRFQADAGLPVTGAVDQRLASELKAVDQAVRAN